LQIDNAGLKPIYIQIAEGIEDDIIAGRLSEGASVYSQLALSRELRVNPATAAKGINLLVAKGILERQRGQSMTVAAGVREVLLEERREGSFESRVRDLMAEARKIGVTYRDIGKIIKKIAQEDGGHEDE
jgi:DNA-binding transcriptional regulator YhcF (GntR family)